MRNCVSFVGALLEAHVVGRNHNSAIEIDSILLKMLRIDRLEIAFLFISVATIRIFPMLTSYHFVFVD